MNIQYNNLTEFEFKTARSGTLMKVGADWVPVDSLPAPRPSEREKYIALQTALLVFEEPERLEARGWVYGPEAKDGIYKIVNAPDKQYVGIEIVIQKGVAYVLNVPDRTWGHMVEMRYWSGYGKSGKGWWFEPMTLLNGGDK